MEKEQVEQHIEYERPEIRDYGDIKDLTASTITGTHTDVPSGTPAPFDFSSGT